MTGRRDRGASRGVLCEARGVLLAVSSALLAVSAHAAADGGVPSLPLTLLLACLVGWVGTALADRSRHLLGVLGALSVAQILIHTMLTVLDAHHGGAQQFDSVAMTVAHACATLLAAVLVSHAERGLLVLVASLRRLLPIVWSPMPAPPARKQRAISAPVTIGVVDILLRRICTRRGPPVLS